MVEKNQIFFSDFQEFFKPDEDKREILKAAPSFFSMDPQSRQEKVLKNNIFKKIKSF